MVLREPKLFVEAKALGQNLDDPRWANQFISYATASGVKWILLTNGDEYRVYNAYAEAPVEQKIFRAVRITDEISRPYETLKLLTKERLERNELEGLWRAQFVDQKVRAVIQGLFSGEGDHRLVNLIRREVNILSPAEIRSSLRRMHIELDFPNDRLDTPATIPSSGSPGQRPEDVPLKELIRDGLVIPPATLQKTYKGRRFTATVESDGRIAFNGRAYNSLSLAAAAARAEVIGVPPGRKYPQTNGWTFWHFVDKDGQLRPMSALRVRYVGEESPVC